MIDDKYSPWQTSRQWRPGVIPVIVKPQNCPIPISKFESDLVKVLGRYNAMLPIEFTYAGQDHCIDVSPGSWPANGVVIHFSSQSIGKLARAALNDLDSDDQWDSGKIEIDGTLSVWTQQNSTGFAFPPVGRWLLVWTLMHEIGHICGINHAQDIPWALMEENSNSRYESGFLPTDLAYMTKIMDGYEHGDLVQNIPVKGNPHMFQAPEFDFQSLHIPWIHENGYEPYTAVLWRTSANVTDAVPPQHGNDLNSGVDREYFNEGIFKKFSDIHFDDWGEYIFSDTGNFFNFFSTVRLTDVILPGGNQIGVVLLDKVPEGWVLVYADGWVNG